MEENPLEEKEIESTGSLDIIKGSDVHDKGEEILKASMPQKVIVALAGLLALVYLLNPGSGIVEIIPDNIPLLGNLDEAGATVMILYAIKFFRDLDKNRPPEK